MVGEATRRSFAEPCKHYPKNFMQRIPEFHKVGLLVFLILKNFFNAGMFLMMKNMSKNACMKVSFLLPLNSEYQAYRNKPRIIKQFCRVFFSSKRLLYTIRLLLKFDLLG